MQRNLMAVWTTFWAVLVKEFLRLRRNVVVLRSLLAIQLVDVTATAWLDFSVRDMPIVVVDRDHTAESRELIQGLEATRTFKVKYMTSSAEQARSHIRAGRAKAAVVIPPEYGRLRAAGQNAQILVFVDGSDSVASAQATSAIDGLTVKISDPSSDVPVVEAREAILFNPNGDTPMFMLPGLLALVLSAAFGSFVLSIANEREDGNLERLVMTPMSPTGLLLGLIMPSVVLVLLNGAVYIGLMRFVFGVPIRGSPGWIFVALALFAFSFLSFTVMIAVSAKTSLDASMNVMILTLPAGLLSGFFFPLSSIPKALLPVSYAMPETHFMEIMRGMCLRGSTVTELGTHFLFLLVTSIVYLVIAVMRLKASLVDD